MGQRQVGCTGAAWGAILLPLPNFFTVEQTTNLFREPIWIERFAQETIETGLARAAHLVFAGFCGHRHDDRIFQAGAGTQLVQRLIAIFIGQADIEQNQIDARQRIGELDNPTFSTHNAAHP